MLERIKKWYKNRSFYKKVFTSHMIVSIIPIAILGIFCYVQTKKLLIQREENVLTETLKQNVMILNAQFDAYENYMNFIAWNESLKKAVTDKYDNNVQMYLAYRDNIDPLIANTMAMNPVVERITIYGNNPTLNPHGQIFLPISKMEIAAEDLEDNRIHWYIDEKEKRLESYCRMYQEKTEENVIYMRFDYDQTFANWLQLFEDDYGIMITKENGDRLFTYDMLGLSEKNLSELYVQKAVVSNQYVVREEVTSLGWKVKLYRPVENIIKPTRTIMVLVLVVILGCIVLLFVVSKRMAKSIVKPLGELSKGIAQIESGNLSVDIIEESSDEIGRVIRSFRKMVERLNYMVKEVYQSRIAQQEYEMKALQAQINPHFLYNSLSLINWKAIIAEQDDISEMAQLLSTFYRTTLNKGKNVIAVKGEWENTCSYVKIQKMLHSGKFEAQLELESGMEHYEMLNLLLQPLVENAIMHGLDHKETDGKKILEVKGWEEEERLVFQVTDNGCGIPKEILDHILKKETTGYGVQNVHQRVQLYYGSAYGLVYESEVGCGTQVTLTIPKVENES